MVIVARACEEFAWIAWTAMAEVRCTEVVALFFSLHEKVISRIAD
jgi:hypothetical protein